MTERDSKAHMHDLFVFETNQLLEQLEQLILEGEKSCGLEATINEVFRGMHTIKGSSSMMFLNNIASLAHSVEDVFHYLREARPKIENYAKLTDLVLHAIDFIKNEVRKIEHGNSPDGDSAGLVYDITNFLSALKRGYPRLTDKPGSYIQEYSIDGDKISGKTIDNGDKNTYEARLFFEADCGMENIRAFTLVHEFTEFADDIQYVPSNLMENDNTAEAIRQEGFRILFTPRDSLETVETFFNKTMFLKEMQIDVVSTEPVPKPKAKKSINLEDPILDNSMALPASCAATDSKLANHKQNFISVNVLKMDMLMDLVGELVIAEVMVTENPELKGLALERFHKAARQLRKITNDLQAVVMSIRMVPLSATFHKMNRIVRDMAKKLNKQAELVIIGDETEVDKNIIEHISDPLMHLVRNAVDHGIESTQERIEQGKSPVGKVKLEAKSAGGEVWIIIRDDGRGLNKEKILYRAKERGLIQTIDGGLTDTEIFSLILQPGFSTKDSITEFSGRGVGMDVVSQNVAKVGGTFHVDSIAGIGTTMTIRIPLTLAIVDGMIIKVGKTVYTVPIVAVKESFRLQQHQVIKDIDNNEMVMIRGDCYPILRLYERFKIKPSATELSNGIMIMVEADGRTLCLFADALIGKQQVVVKALPQYIKKAQGIAGCTLLGDGSVSLILDVAALVHA